MNIYREIVRLAEEDLKPGDCVDPLERFQARLDRIAQVARQGADLPITEVWTVRKVGEPDGLYVFIDERDAIAFAKACEDAGTEVEWCKESEPLLQGEGAQEIIDSVE